jgi:hypothetical protein
LVSKKIKCDVRIPPFPLSVLTVDDLGFGGMHLQVTLRQPSLKISLDGLRFLLGPTVHQPVIRISTPREAVVFPTHP